MSRDIAADICVIGAGAAGLSVAAGAGSRGGSSARVAGRDFAIRRSSG